MVNVSIEVRAEAACFKLAVRAESIRRAVNLVEGLYPETDVRVKFPIDPEGFFVIEDSAAQVAMVEAQLPQKLVA